MKMIINLMKNHSLIKLNIKITKIIGIKEKKALVVITLIDPTKNSNKSIIENYIIIL